VGPMGEATYICTQFTVRVRTSILTHRIVSFALSDGGQENGVYASSR
jgi:hypothetical protein